MKKFIDGHTKQCFWEHKVQWIGHVRNSMSFYDDCFIRSMLCLAEMDKAIVLVAMTVTHSLSLPESRP